MQRLDGVACRCHKQRLRALFVFMAPIICLRRQSVWLFPAIWFIVLLVINQSVWH
ncbi:hypothetical protein CJA_1460 [Cellvibrio japonicus Ueda107]|uniref:Uncharacterized protein n=1 Tax=Cellvibrio japonicus (strain Ueda107) TaxID=498211 RepID=B3PDK0_CELJU|nr:hypothetical protein CJA_1460 [Cellvibrio japonicus Ueda107]